MAKYIYILLFFQFTYCPFAKSQKGKVWGVFNQKIEVNELINKRLHLEANIKGQVPDTSCKAGILIIFLDKKNRTIAQFKETGDKPIEDKWQKHVIEAKVPKGAMFALVGGEYTNKGLFFYDDLKLNIIDEAQDGSNNNLFVNPSFEDSLQGTWEIGLPGMWFNLSLTEEESYSGKKSLKVDGRTYTRLIIYGKNDSAGKYIIANNIKIYYEVYGEGDPLILLHGNGQSIGFFSQQIFAFSKHFKVYAIDTRGHGKSYENGLRYTYDLFAEDVNAFMDSLKLSNATIVGWSDGGNTGLILAMKYPERVKTLVTMGAVAFIDNSVVDKSTFRMLHKGIRYFQKDTSYVSRNKARLTELLLTEPKHTFEDLEKIKCPVLVMAGQKDIVKEEHTRAIAKSIKRSTLNIVAGATHFLPQENGRLFNKIVLEYLGY